jgi:hypothetical protein
MKKLRWTLLLAAGLLVQACTSNPARPDTAAASPPPMKAAASLPPMKLDLIVTQQQEIRAGVIAGAGRFKDMPENTKAELLAKQGQLLKLIDGKADTAELTPAQSIEAFNLLEWIKAAVNSTDDERMVCRNERRIGSNRMTAVCRTQRQINEARQRTKDNERGRLQTEYTPATDR